MSDKNDAQSGNNLEATEPHAVQVNIRMQQGEHTGQPIYSNFTSVQSGQGVIIVDFGFLDPQAINVLNRLAKSGEKMPDTVSARMSCRMALSSDAANNLVRQLNQLLHKQVEQKSVGGSEATPGANTIDKKNAMESEHRGFRLPWSNKVQ